MVFFSLHEEFIKKIGGDRNSITGPATDTTEKVVRGSLQKVENKNKNKQKNI